MSIKAVCVRVCIRKYAYQGESVHIRGKLCVFEYVSVRIRAHSLVVSDLRSENKRSQFKSGYYLCAEVSSLQ